ncbi:hypothetical protein NC653_017756 [Populus alba x Populus x berolinensis]|uniref:Uncharacterized protein n=1 Tax=Populus alba x Populus x berolinensis TaxID=444605 RepID=A0AAD6QR16_9ROSI|nr:hypothetical protein NC653_017756 [Populus alba x Populus x berolinensis]
MYGLNWQGSIPSACDFHLFKSVSGDGMHLLWHRIIVLLLPIARAHILESWIGQQKSIDMSTWVLNSVCIGFTSTTGPFLESHERNRVRNWCIWISSYPPMILAAKNISETSRQGQLYLFIALKISK